MSNRMRHVQRSFHEIACVLNKFWLVESWFLDTRSSGSRYIAQWNDFRPIRIQDARPIRIQYTGCILASDWLKIIPLCGWKSFHCAICCHWTLYPNINFQWIRNCLTHAQIRRMTVGHVSFRWTCIALHNVVLLSADYFSMIIMLPFLTDLPKTMLDLG